MFIEKVSTVAAATPETELGAMTEITELHRVIGDAFLFAKVKADDLDGLADIVERRLHDHHHIDCAHKHVSMQDLKEDGHVPIELLRDG